MTTFLNTYKSARNNCRMLNELGEPFPDLGECMTAGQSIESLAQSTQSALVDSCGPMLADMRDWLSDCAWRDEDSNSIAEMPDIQIIRAVSRHFSGGLEEFAACI